MENRRGGLKGDTYFSSGVPRRRPFNKKPPRGSWQPAVPSWEKKFCKVIGTLDWETILCMKKFVYLYENVVKWDDSAGEEAFHNAKKRFLADMHGLPCDITLPDPDLYINQVDWDAKVDAALLSELEYGSVVPDMAQRNEQVVIFGDSLLLNQGFSASGWGECEEDFKKDTNAPSNNDDSQWGRRRTTKENDWEDSANNARVPDVDAGRFMSRYKTSRFHGNEQQGSYAWRNGNGRKRGTFFHESSTAEHLMNSCGPLSYHAYGKAGQTWNSKKPVS